jgi:serine/threonine protein kinase
LEKNERRSSLVGSIDYKAPEMFRSEGYSIEVDIWAFGVIIYQLLFGKLPFYDKNEKLI